ncbi:Rdx family-domain-containing protein [Aspergillus spectabilis]
MADSATPPPQPTSTSTSISRSKLPPPRITIQYCTQCKWMLRAAYFAQELLSTFSTDLAEVALIPKTGGIFTVTIFPSSSSASTRDGDPDPNPEPEWVREGTILWDRKRDGGFPEVKVLKSLVRNVIDPKRDLGHTDRALKKSGSTSTTTGVAGGESTTAESTTTTTTTGTGEPRAEKEKECEDCK